MAQTEKENLVTLLVDVGNLRISVFDLLAETHSHRAFHNSQDQIAIRSYSIVVKSHLLSSDVQRLVEQIHITVRKNKLSQVPSAQNAIRLPIDRRAPIRRQQEYMRFPK